MGFTAFAGLLFLSAGPLSVIYVSCIARKSFLVLLSLGSAFYWLITLFVISGIFRVFEPLGSSLAPYASLILVAVLIQTLAGWGLWRVHKIILLALADISRHQDHAGSSLSIADHFALSLTHGLSHGMVHSLFFCICWLPLCLGSGTLYFDNCPMSYYLVSALSTLGMSAVLTGGTIVAFGGLEAGNFKQGIVPPIAHGAAALLTLINFFRNGCLISIPLLLVIGGIMSAWAGQMWWSKTGTVLQKLPPQTSRVSREENLSQRSYSLIRDSQPQ